MKQNDAQSDEQSSEGIRRAFSETPRQGATVKITGETCPEGIAFEALPAVAAWRSGPRISGYEPEEVRQMRRAAGNPFDYDNIPSVKKTDFTIPGPASDLPARLYDPEPSATGDRPSLIYFHGGGFCLGEIASYDGLLTQMAHDSGLLMVSVEYRLAPETPFPGGVLDTQQAFNWMYEHAADFGMDRARMAIGGDSAGGNLAAVACVLNRDAGLPMPAVQWLIYPSTIANNSSDSRERLHDAPVIPKDILAWMHDHYMQGGDSDDPRFNVMATPDLSGLPPAFILTAGYDPLMDEGELYANRLREAGVPVRYSCYTDMFHGFLNYGKLPQARAAVTESAAVMSAALSSC